MPSQRPARVVPSGFSGFLTRDCGVMLQQNKGTRVFLWPAYLKNWEVLDKAWISAVHKKRKIRSGSA